MSYILKLSDNFTLRRNDAYGFDRQTLVLYRFNKFEYALLQLIKESRNLDVGEVMEKDEQLKKFLERTLADGILVESEF